ncbi:hypothetical protein Ga0074812_1384 [Parafrankia irregularis]|uniref:Uncharacterized protein n=1 Tax=Parafrankia irregularis TaxID=795642 RepID=A0A0S4QXE6_9ACTN|nr:hypothetical protein Ga0074812_1384 [Parafrankia irregularis]
MMNNISFEEIGPVAGTQPGDAAAVSHLPASAAGAFH